MTQEAGEVKTFNEAVQRLKEMAAGRNYSVQISHDSYREPPISVSLYIEDIGFASNLSTYAEAFTEMEALIHRADSDYNPDALLDGVDEALQEATA